MKLVVNDIQKQFGGHTVLDGASFTFEEGVRYALLGRNGAGKTTLFSIISDELREDGGQVLLEEEGESRPLQASDLLFMVSEPDLPGFLTGYEFIRFFVQANADQIGEAVDIDHYFDQVELDERDRHRLILSYSTGMKNKLQTLMFLILRPRIILMDEPLTSLDVVAQLEIKKWIRSIYSDRIIIFSTHILQLARDLCDRIVILNHGKLQEMPVEDLRDPQLEEKVIQLLGGGEHA